MFTFESSTVLYSVSNSLILRTARPKTRQPPMLPLILEHSSLESLVSRRVCLLTPRLAQGNVLTALTEDIDRMTAESIFAQNPKLVSMIQGKLGTLVGRSSGYIESLPAPVRRRVAGLKGVQKEHAKFEAQFQEDVLQLEKKYFTNHFGPLYEKRAKIVNGSVEPSDEEVKLGEEDAEMPDAEEGAKPAETKTEESSESVNGVPEFWLSAMKNQISLAEMITDRDELALKYLVDIRLEYLDRPGFRLLFEFSENEFFTNKVITKTYFYQEDVGYGGDFIYDHAEGDAITWKPGKDLTVKIESKKQRNKSETILNASELFDLICWHRYKADPDRQENRPYRVVLQLLLSTEAASFRSR